jgi:hypothetical protein
MPMSVSQCGATTANEHVHVEVTAQAATTNPLYVQNCSRLGLRANPPTSWLSLCGWFRRR